MNFNHKAIGIWGFGVVGKSAAYYATKAGASVSIIDKRELTDEEQKLVTILHLEHHVLHDEEQIKVWLSQQDYVIASPGIDLRPFAAFHDRFIAELDLFYYAFQRPIIAVTGSVGKTSVTHLLSQLLPDRYPHLWTGGNIGTGMLDALQDPDADAALLELSSFQLEPCKHFAPNLAIVTNLYPNHLDRHGSMKSYSDAKKHMVLQQKKGQIALLPLTCKEWASQTEATVHFFSEHEITGNMPPHASFFFIREGIIVERTASGERSLAALADIPAVTFAENLLIITAALRLLTLPIDRLCSDLGTATLPPHRLEHVTTLNGVSFYNDSKATTIAASTAAVNQLAKNERPIILIVGGLGKGVDRTPFIASLKNKVSFIYCVGKERDQLRSACLAHAIAHKSCDTLDEILKDYWPRAKSGDQFLLSPAGTSYDQFINYEERGNYFKSCVAQLH